jgi:hypothetical protein
MIADTEWNDLTEEAAWQELPWCVVSLLVQILDQGDDFRVRQSLTERRHFTATHNDLRFNRA